MQREMQSRSQVPKVFCYFSLSPPCTLKTQYGPVFVGSATVLPHASIIIVCVWVGVCAYGPSKAVFIITQQNAYMYDVYTHTHTHKYLLWHIEEHYKHTKHSFEPFNEILIHVQPFQKHSFLPPLIFLSRAPPPIHIRVPNINSVPCLYACWLWPTMFSSNVNVVRVAFGRNSWPPLR